MNEYLLYVGDEVVITVPSENQEADHDPYQDSIPGVVVGFSSMYWPRIHNATFPPGTYRNTASPIVQFASGEARPVYISVVELADANEYAERLARWFDQGGSELSDPRRDYLDELPHTPFWEGDIVQSALPLHMGTAPDGTPVFQDRFVIAGIDYNMLGRVTAIGTPWPVYSLSDDLYGGPRLTSPGVVLELAERGPVWKFHHGEPIEFRDVFDEARFHVLLGHYDERRNPATGIYVWRLDEVVEAVQQGIIHCFIGQNHKLLDRTFGVRAIVFRDADLGARMAAETLTKFSS